MVAAAAAEKLVGIGVSCQGVFEGRANYIREILDLIALRVISRTDCGAAAVRQGDKRGEEWLSVGIR
jgi:hypothetical protein